jgi:threonine synthase
MQYYSTNRRLPGGFSETVSFRTALFTGQAPDEGLFMPEKIPRFSENQLSELRNLNYPDLAARLLHPFLEDEISLAALEILTRQAYTFSIPIEDIDNQTFIARMDAGPTASFKDFAAQLMARLMQFLLAPHQQVNILVATSGDTGSAVGEAFRGLAGMQVFILYPEKEVSEVQRRQLTTLGDNVKALEMSGKFDDCQQFVKMAFADKSLKNLNLTSANSLNIGRLLPQLVYYFYLYFQVAEPGEKLNFCIPTGNLGNALGCELARQMGLPINRIVVATNGNNTLPSWLESGSYAKVEPSKNCLSNAMNVGNPSNLARWFDLSGGTLDRSGTTHRLPDLQTIREHLSAYEISDAETIKAVKQIYEKYKILIEPHGAVGWAALEKYRKAHPQDNSRSVVLETAHPAKFPEVFQKHLGISPEIPENLQKTMEKREEKIRILPEYKVLQRFLVKQLNNGMID